MQKILTGLIAILISSIMFVWPLMHTIGLRYSLGGLLVMAVFIWLPANKSALNNIRFCLRPLLIASGFLAFLTLWFIAQGIWVAPEANWVWSELRGQWLKDLVFWILGLALGIGALRQREQGENQWLLGLLLGLAGVVLVNVAMAFWAWISMGPMPRMYDGLTGSRTMSSFITNMLLAFLVGDILARERCNLFLPWARAITIVLVIVALLNTLFIGTRHGWVGVGMIACSGVIVHYINGWEKVSKRALLFLPVLVMLLISSIWVSWKTDSRWHSLKETLPIAWDIESNKAWLNPMRHPYPTLSNGQTVDASNYERPAWIHAGLRLAMERPLGAGFSRHAFGHELARLYPDSNPSSGMHAHSSMIDLAIGGGVPAVVLWLGFIGTLLWAGGVAYFRFGSGAGLTLFFLTSGFFGRSFLDSVMRDHSLEQFMFIVAFLLPSVASAIRSERKKK